MAAARWAGDSEQHYYWHATTGTVPQQPGVVRWRGRPCAWLTA